MGHGWDSVRWGVYYRKSPWRPVAARQPPPWGLPFTSFVVGARAGRLRALLKRGKLVNQDPFETEKSVSLSSPPILLQLD